MKPVYTKPEVEAQINSCEDFDHLHLLIDLLLHEERKNYAPDEFMDILLHLIRKHAEISHCSLQENHADVMLKELTDCLFDVSFWKCDACHAQNPVDITYCLHCKQQLKSH